MRSLFDVIKMFSGEGYRYSSLRILGGGIVQLSVDNAGFDCAFEGFHRISEDDELFEEVFREIRRLLRQSGFEVARDTLKFKNVYIDEATFDRYQRIAFKTSQICALLPLLTDVFIEPNDVRASTSVETSVNEADYDLSEMTITERSDCIAKIMPPFLYCASEEGVLLDNYAKLLLEDMPLSQQQHLVNASIAITSRDSRLLTKESFSQWITFIVSCKSEIRDTTSFARYIMALTSWLIESNKVGFIAEIDSIVPLRYIFKGFSRQINASKSCYGEGISQMQFKLIQRLAAYRYVFLNHDEFNLINALDKLRLERKRIADLQGSRGFDCERMVRGLRGTHTPISGRYLPYSRSSEEIYESLPQTAGYAADFRSKPYDLGGVVGGFMYAHIAKCDSYPCLFWIQDSMMNHPELVDRLEQEIRELLERKHCTKADLITSLSRIHWHLAHLAFSKRGSAWIYDTLMIGLAMKKGYLMTWDSKTMLDCTALSTLNVEYYIKEYAKLVTLMDVRTELFDDHNLVDGCSVSPMLHRLSLFGRETGVFTRREHGLDAVPGNSMASLHTRFTR